MQMTFMAVFFYFFYQSFMASYVTQKFVSLSPDSGVCKPVARPYTIPYITADFNANWQGTFSYNSNRNFYAFNLFDISLSSEGYVALMKEFADAIAIVGGVAQRSELSVSLLYFNSYSYSIATDGSLGGKVTQTLSFPAHAINILGTEFISGTVMNMKVDQSRKATQRFTLTCNLISLPSSHSNFKITSA